MSTDVTVGILGVGIICSQDMGDSHMINVLFALAFDYPDMPNCENCSMVFRNQLKDLLLWCRDMGTSTLLVLGSYADTVGTPQLMPTSICEHAIDYGRDGHIDLRNSAMDAIGGVVRFL